MQIHITSRKIPLRRALRDFIHDHVAGVLDLFTRRVSSIQVHLRDRNGRRGGGDKQCRIRVLLADGVPVLAEDEQASIRTAIRHAAARAAMAVRARLR